MLAERAVARYEATRRIQDLEQFTCRKRTSKMTDNIRI